MVLSDDSPPEAPELEVSRWFNTPSPLTLAGMRGEVVAIEAFQMLCPGCVLHGIPQAKRLHAAFGDELRVIGLHTVFEHHDAMQPVSLEAFLHEFGVGFPVGVDAHDEVGGPPVTMQRYGLRGTPSLVLVDRAGRVRFERLGQVDDLELGSHVARLLDEAPPPTHGDP